jgi:hypothetical protein
MARSVDRRAAVRGKTYALLRSLWLRWTSLRRGVVAALALRLLAKPLRHHLRHEERAILSLVAGKLDITDGESEGTGVSATVGGKRIGEAALCAAYASAAVPTCFQAAAPM